ncbi:MAG: PucR family transcriptional regulator ligand-binding domain-containing protein [Lachnospiraceae bacterium]|nr:PucR family transcriptional regulator ligand-binding domain-containing protein [Lachnospiraceae bacterium]
MNCDDLMSMKEIRSGLRLVAGESGIHRNIRWIYFADCIQCLEGSVPIQELIHGEELVIITNLSLTEDEQGLLQMVDQLYEKNVAGFVINEGQISEKLIQHCNILDLPLFELSVNLHLIDFSQIICKVLVEEESNVSSRERILTSILYSEQLNVSELMEQANYLEIDLSGKFRTAVFGWKDEQVRRINQADEGSSIERRNQIKKWILNEFRSYGLQHMMLHSRIDTIIIMFPDAMFSHDLLVSILQHIIQQMEDYYKLNAKVGIGSGYEYINEFKLSYQEAKNTLKISSMISDTQKIFFYEDLGIYSLLAQITNGKFLDDFVENKLGRLLQAEEMQEGDLCETLEAYLMHDCNANATAESLFIHRNTMRYRLDKIRHILDIDLSELSECLELKLAFAILKYRKNRDEYPN